MAAHQAFFTHVKEDHWVSLQDAVLMSSPAADMGPDTEQAVVQVYEACHASLVRVPSHVIHGLKKSQEDTSALEPFSVTEVNPQTLSDLMRNHPAWQSDLTGKDKCLVLAYLCQHGDPSLLHDLKLLPLADGSFCTFSHHVVYVCRDARDLDLLPGIKSQLCYVGQESGLEVLQQQLIDLAKSGTPLHIYIN
jgi:hypothetical protein